MENTIHLHRIISHSCCTFLRLLLDSSVRRSLGKPAFAVNGASHLLIKDTMHSTSNLRFPWEFLKIKPFLICA